MKQKNFVIEIYEKDGVKTYLVKEIVPAGNGAIPQPVLVTQDAADVANFLSNCQI